ncbi:ADP-ribosylation factor-binding protein GGA1 [Aphelenchoides besseyi]|nr:ADP-ribosylation factor-binding protein GGA1 [Aphelenchoides besseyi]KAI6229387.1 ADP-ribosylation factor-binding protein GGA1 [Aphelenchoides besseyi]
MTTESDANSLEYLIARATDHFQTSGQQRNEYIDRICTQLDSDFDGPYVALKLLSHKMLSPDQIEAFKALDTMESLVGRCGLRVANEVGKYKFLNQFIRLLSPKYQGLQTSEKVRDKAISLLHTWRHSMRHLHKLTRVYDELIEQKIVDADCLMEQSQIPKLSIRRMAASSVEDEEQSRLLTHLLYSKNPQDLQAANRMIKTIVKMEDHKQEREQKRSDTIAIARTKRALLNDLMVAYDREADSEERPLMKELFDYLIDVRPQLFHYAAEAANQQEDILSEILALNDDLNSTIQSYKDRFESVFPIESSVQTTKQLDKCLLSDLDNDDADDIEAIDRVHFDPLAKLEDGNIHGTVIQRKPTPYAKVANVFADDELDLFTDNQPPSNSSTIDQPVASGSHSLSNDFTNLSLSNRFSSSIQTSSSISTHKEDTFLLKDVSIGVNEIEFPSIEPIIFCDQQHIKGLLHYAKSNKNDRAVLTVATVTFTHSHPLHDVRLHFSSKSPMIAYRNVDEKSHNFDAYNPLGSVHKITQMFLVLPLTRDLTSVDIDYVLISEQFKCNGTFNLSLKHE